MIVMMMMKITSSGDDNHNNGYDDDNDYDDDYHHCDCDDGEDDDNCVGKEEASDFEHININFQFPTLTTLRMVFTPSLSRVVIGE